jgi:hypothetical protein
VIVRTEAIALVHAARQVISSVDQNSYSEASSRSVSKEIPLHFVEGAVHGPNPIGPSLDYSLNQINSFEILYHGYLRVVSILHVFFQTTNISENKRWDSGVNVGTSQRRTEMECCEPLKEEY